MGTAGGRTTDEERNSEALALHFARNVHHFIQRGCDEAAEPDHVNLLLAGGLEYLLAGNHDAQVDHLVVVAPEHHTDDVFPDVMNVALHGSHQDLSFSLAATTCLFLCFHERQQPSDCLLHHSCALHHL